MWTFIHKLGSPPWFFGFSGTLVRWLLPITVILLLVGSIWGLLLAPPDFRQGNSYRIIYIHVPAAVVALAGYYVMAFAGAVSLIWRIKMADVAMRAAAPVGAVLTAIALVTGAIWGKPTWGTWWVWDARLTSMLVLMLFYIFFIISFKVFKENEKLSKILSAISILGIINIPIIKYSVEWWSTLHQPASIKFLGTSSIHSSMLTPLFLMLLVLLMYCALIFLMKYKTEIIKIKKRNIKRL